MSFQGLPGGMLAYCIFLSFCLGAVLGSFLNCAAFRIAHGESFVKGRSRCPDCGHELGAAELIPVLSWLIQKGRCRHCGAKISPRYLIAELLFAVLTVGCLLRFGLRWEALRVWGFLCCLFLLSLVDLEISEIPDGALLAAAAIWLVTAPLLWNGWADALLHVAAGVVYGAALLLLSLALDKLLKKESLGGGDIKLLAVIGLYLGFVQTLFCVLLACLLGLAQALLTGKTRGKQFPFGPALSAAAAIMLFFGTGFANWYLGLFRF